MAGTPVALHWTLFKPRHFHSMQFLAGLNIANLKAKQSVDIYITKRIAPIDCERSNDIFKWADRGSNFVLGRVGNGQQRRLQSRHVDVLSVRRINCVVRCRLSFDFGNHVPVHGVYH